MFCNPKAPLKLKEDFYWIVVRPTMLYKTRCWGIKNQLENKISAEEIRILSWMCINTRQNKIINDIIRGSVRISLKVEKFIKNRLK